ncbi:MAG: hypothetical protein KBG17_08910 [Paludibacteraceae bacterium]|jgi:hypothetical protein|nr:hypothetical protein [Bacteroidales bacterium]MBP9017843.1 hypothetical protein [Paludibacteraceae bacterium]
MDSDSNKIGLFNLNKLVKGNEFEYRKSHLTTSPKDKVKLGIIPSKSFQYYSSRASDCINFIEKATIKQQEFDFYNSFINSQIFEYSIIDEDEKLYRINPTRIIDTKQLVTKMIKENSFKRNSPFLKRLRIGEIMLNKIGNGNNYFNGFELCMCRVTECFNRKIWLIVEEDFVSIPFSIVYVSPYQYIELITDDIMDKRANKVYWNMRNFPFATDLIFPNNFPTK